MSKVVGLDLSLTGTGICHPHGTTRVVKTRDKDGDERLRVIRNAVLEDAFGCDLAVIEDWIGSYAGPILGMVHGTVRTLLMDHGVPYVKVSPPTLKKFATGSGKSDKPAMAVAAYKRAGVEFPGDKDGDQCDAWWLRAAGLYLLGEPPFDLPAAQVDALSVLTLPDACRAAATTGKAAA